MLRHANTGSVELMQTLQSVNTKFPKSRKIRNKAMHFNFIFIFIPQEIAIVNFKL